MRESHDPDSTTRGDRGFFALTVGRPVALLVAFVTLLVIGGIAYSRIPLKLLPSSFQDPSLNVWIPNPDASAQENEEKVTRIIEEELRTLSGIERTFSRSSEGSVFLRIWFSPDIDLDLAKSEVRDRIERARTRIPESVDRISMWSEVADQLPVAWFGVLHEGDSDRTDFLIEKHVIPRLEAVHGISKVDVFGLLQDSVRILLDEDKVLAARLDLGDLVGRLSRDNFAQPLGEIDDGGKRFLMRTDMRFGSLEEIGNFPVTADLTLSDLGEVRMVKSVRDSVARIDGQYAYYGMATKESTANAVEASKGFRKAIEEIENDPAVAGQISFIPFFVQGDLIENSLSQLKETALWGGALAVVVLFVFLRRTRLTLCVALSIPVSALLAIAWEYFRGQSFNVLTMAGLTLAIGMLVDNSVVVIENIARMRTQGMDGKAAARRGSSEIALAVTLATLTSVVVFMPLIFMSGNPMVRVIFGGIGLPLCMALVFSLLVALVFLPVVTARVVGERAGPVERVAGLLAPIAAIPVRLAAIAIGAVRAAWWLFLTVAKRVERVIVAVLAFAPIRFALAGGVVWLVWVQAKATTGALQSTEGLPDEMGIGPGMDPVSFAIQSYAIPGALLIALLLFGLPRWRRRPKGAPARPEHFVPKGTSMIDMIIAANGRLIRWTLEHRFAASVISVFCFFSIFLPANQLPTAAFMEGDDTDSVRFYVDFDAEFTLAEASDEMRVYEELVVEHQDELGFKHYSCRFDDEDGRIELFWDTPLTRDDVVTSRTLLRGVMPQVSGHTVRFYDGQDAQKSSKSVAVFQLSGPDSTGLERFGRQAVALLKEVPGLSNVSSPLDRAPAQLELSIDRDLALEMGVASEVALNTIAWTLRGWSLPRYHEEGREVPLIIEYDEEEAAGVETLRDLRVWSPQTMSLVPLSSFSSIGVSKGRQSIYRRNGQTTFTVQGDIDDPARFMEINEAAYAALATIDLPRGYSIGTDDDARFQQQQQMGEMARALALSIVLVFLLMGILFESVLLPFSVLFTIPFAILGAVWTLFLTGSTMDFMGWIGFIILAGVVVNNGIVLIDRIHRLRGEGLERSAAVVEGCAHRVRPILMTALTTVFGLLPMAVSTPATNSISYKILAIVVAGGLITSTFFTLWVVPLAYTVLDDLTHASKRAVAWAVSRWSRTPVSAGSVASTGPRAPHENA